MGLKMQLNSKRVTGEERENGGRERGREGERRREGEGEGDGEE